MPKTKDCIKMITDNKGKFKVPTLFLTNAGNELRSSKSAKLSQILGLQVKVLLSANSIRNYFILIDFSTQKSPTN